LLFYMLPTPTLILFTLANYINKINRLRFEREIGIKFNVNKNKVQNLKANELNGWSGLIIIFFIEFRHKPYQFAAFVVKFNI